MKSFFKHSWIAAVAISSALCANIIEIQTDQAPQAIGPYSQAVQAGPYLFVSGQLALDPDSNKLVGVTIEEQTSQVLITLKDLRMLLKLLDKPCKLLNFPWMR